MKDIPQSHWLSLVAFVASIGSPGVVVANPHHQHQPIEDDEHDDPRMLRMAFQYLRWLAAPHLWSIPTASSNHGSLLIWSRLAAAAAAQTASCCDLHNAAFLASREQTLYRPCTPLLSNSQVLVGLLGTAANEMSPFQNPNVDVSRYWTRLPMIVAKHQSHEFFRRLVVVSPCLYFLRCDFFYSRLLGKDALRQSLLLELLWSKVFLDLRLDRWSTLLLQCKLRVSFLELRDLSLSAADC